MTLLFNKTKIYQKAIALIKNLSRLQTEDKAEIEIFESLRQWRNELAKTRGVRPFTIFSNQTLKNIARARPETNGELRAIYGIGPIKLEQYGAKVLEILRGFLE